MSSAPSWSGASLIVVALATAFVGAAQAQSVTVLPLDFKVAEFRGPGSQEAKIVPTTDALRRHRLGSGPIVVVWGEGRAAALYLAEGELKILPFTPPSGEGPSLGEAPRDAIPGSRVQSAGAVTVHLAGPTTAYVHGALGGVGEARDLVITERQPVAMSGGVQKVPVERTRIEAGPDAVFEDREPRLADLDGDDAAEILVVKSYQAKGSALAVLGKREGAWRVITETPPLGQAQRWLNPAAVAAFQGDGKPAIALVKTPHLDGVLQVWAYDGGKLVLRHEAPGYSNHVFGSAAQELAAAVDLDGDGVPELAIPTLDRGSIALLSLKGGIKELRRIPLPAKAATGVAALGSGKTAHILVGLEDGRIADVRP
jgi:hypothetical protein